MAESNSSRGDRLLQLIQLFYTVKPGWSVDEAARELGISVSTTYRYFRALLDAGMLVAASPGQYVLGPAFIEIYRCIRDTDPVLRQAVPVLRWLSEKGGPDVTALLCRFYRDRVMCVHQVQPSRGGPPPVGYEYGKPMPLFRGATSKVILANLPSRTLRRLYQANARSIAEAGLGGSFEEFKTQLRTIRASAYWTTQGDVDAGMTGIAAPIFDWDRAVIGSVSVVVPSDASDAADRLNLGPLVAAAARAIDDRLQLPAPAAARC